MAFLLFNIILFVIIIIIIIIIIGIKSKRDVLHNVNKNIKGNFVSTEQLYCPH